MLDIVIIHTVGLSVRNTVLKLMVRLQELDVPKNTKP